MEIVKLIGSDVLPDDQKLTAGDRQSYPSGLFTAERIPSAGYLCASWQSSRR